MAEIVGKYDTESGEFTVTVDGKEIPSVTNFNISAPAFYDSDEDEIEDYYGPKVRCYITTVEQEGELKKYSNYSNAGEKSKAGINDNKSDIPVLMKTNDLKLTINNYLISR